MPRRVLVLLDTSVYLRVLLERAFADAAEPTLRRIGPRIRLSSVVRAELTQGARGPAGRALVDHLARRLERLGRVVAPSHDDWVRAGTVQSKIWDAHPGLRTKRLLNDLLIACAARRVGALLVTDDERDFPVLDRWLPTERIDADELTRL